MKTKLSMGKTAVVLAVVMILAVIIVRFFGFTSVRSAIRVGCLEHFDSRNWSASYFFMNGLTEKTICSDGGILSVAVKTDAGTISMEVKDTGKNIIFSRTDIETENFQVPVPDKVMITIKTNNHKGGFEISG